MVPVTDATLPGENGMRMENKSIISPVHTYMCLLLHVFIFFQLFIQNEKLSLS